MPREFQMILVLVALGVALVATAGPARAQVAAPDPSSEAARLLAAEVAARAKGYSAGRGIMTPKAQQTLPPAMPHPAPGAIAGGERFMPLRRDTAARDFPVPGRVEPSTTAEAVRASLAGSKSQRDLANAALAAGNAPSPAAAAAAEVQRLNAPTPAAAGDDADARAKAAVIEAFQRYRGTHTTR